MKSTIAIVILFSLCFVGVTSTSDGSNENHKFATPSPPNISDTFIAAIVVNEVDWGLNGVVNQSTGTWFNDPANNRRLVVFNQSTVLVFLVQLFSEVSLFAVVEFLVFYVYILLFPPFIDFFFSSSYCNIVIF